MKNNITKYACRECQSVDICVRAWVDINTLEYIEDIECDGEAWCEDCGDTVATVQLQTIVTLFDLEEEKMERFTIPEILEEINRDRTDDWTPYTSDDWREGWDEFCEGNVYKLLKIKWEVVK